MACKRKEKENVLYSRNPLSMKPLREVALMGPNWQDPRHVCLHQVCCSLARTIMSRSHAYGCREGPYFLITNFKWVPPPLHDNLNLQPSSWYSYIMMLPQMEYDLKRLVQILIALIFYSALPNLGKHNLSERNKIRPELSSKATLQEWRLHDNVDVNRCDGGS